MKRAALSSVELVPAVGGEKRQMLMDLEYKAKQQHLKILSIQSCQEMMTLIKMANEMSKQIPLRILQQSLPPGFPVYSILTTIKDVLLWSTPFPSALIHLISEYCQPILYVKDLVDSSVKAEQQGEEYIERRWEYVDMTPSHVETYCSETNIKQWIPLGDPDFEDASHPDYAKKPNIPVMIDGEEYELAYPYLRCVSGRRFNIFIDFIDRSMDPYEL